MKAFVATQLGKTAKAQIQDMPMPVLGDNDVLIKVVATSINPLDLKILKGEINVLVPYQKQTPLILGNDVAGVAEQVGRNVRKFKIGDEVYSRPNHYRIGTFAEYIAIAEQDVALKPNNISMAEAASIPLVGLTAWQVLVELGKVKAGQKVLIHAGSGGVGTIAIQLAKQLGAYVATTASAKNGAWLESLGADVVIDYKTQDFSEILTDYDLILDSQGGDTLAKSVKSLKNNGQLISLAGPPNPEFAQAFGANWLAKMASYMLSYRIRQAVGKKNASYQFIFMHADGTQLDELTQLIEQGKIKPIIDKTFDFSQIQQALDYVVQGRSKGKVVVE